MKVLVLSTMVPFVHGGAEELYDHLVLNLRRQGIEAEGMRIPFTWAPADRLIDEMLIARQIRLCNVDRLIALKFPAYMVPWHDKVVWLLHQFRQAYDLLDAGQSHLSADGLAFQESRRIHTNAPITARRLKHYNGFDSDVLRPPLNDPELFPGGESEGYVLATGRVNAGKRQAMLVRALRHAPGVRLVIAGPPDTPADAEAIRRLVVEEGVEDRVTLDLRFLPRDELARMVNGALAVAYLPFDEDSLGYCTMEAFRAAKPVITTTDSGGVLDIVRDGENGHVVTPDPEALGAAIAALAANASRARMLGLAGRAAMEAERLDWPTTIERLVS
jgi:glycosyltransferase involved in cell wall biosynthesis